MKIIYGDLINLALQGKFDVIIHGCNCFHTMGAGIARQIKQIFPDAYKIDLETPYGDKEKLGKFSYVKCGKITVVNLYSQFDFRGEHNVNYDAIRRGFDVIQNLFSGKRIGYPKIGAGLAGGDWKIIAPIIDKELEGEDHTLVIFDK